MARSASLLAAVAAASLLGGRDGGLAPPAAEAHGGFLREAGAAVDEDDQARFMEASEIAREVGAPAGAQQLRAAALKPTDVTHGRLCRSGPDTTSEKALLNNAKTAVEMLYDMVNQSGWTHHGSDSNREWAAEGGQAAEWAHVYGEVEREGMFDILKTAVCIAEPEKCKKSTKDLVELFRTFHFYDLGSGQGKFPMFATLVGFEYAKGIELDKHRDKYAQRVRADFDTVYPCLSRKFGLEHASFLEPDSPWTRSEARRVVFLDAVCFKDMWKDISRMMMEGRDKWGQGSVVAVLGREFDGEDSGLFFRESKKEPASWVQGNIPPTVNFYTFKAR